MLRSAQHLLPTQIGLHVCFLFFFVQLIVFFFDKQFTAVVWRPERVHQWNERWVWISSDVKWTYSDFSHMLEHISLISLIWFDWKIVFRGKISEIINRQNFHYFFSLCRPFESIFHRSQFIRWLAQTHSIDDDDDRSEIRCWVNYENQLEHRRDMIVQH